MRIEAQYNHEDDNYHLIYRLSSLDDPVLIVIPRGTEFAWRAVLAAMQEHEGIIEDFGILVEL